MRHYFYETQKKDASRADHALSNIKKNLPPRKKAKGQQTSKVIAQNPNFSKELHEYKNQQAIVIIFKSHIGKQ